MASRKRPNRRAFLPGDLPCSVCVGACSRSGGCVNSDEAKAARNVPRNTAARFTVRDHKANVVGGLENIERDNANLNMIMPTLDGVMPTTLATFDTMAVGAIITGIDRIGVRYWIERVS